MNFFTNNLYLDYLGVKVTQGKILNCLEDKDKFMAMPNFSLTRKTKKLGVTRKVQRQKECLTLKRLG